MDKYETFEDIQCERRSSPWQVAATCAGLALFAVAGLGAFTFGRHVYTATFVPSTSAPGVIPFTSTARMAQQPLRASRVPLSSFTRASATDPKLRGAPLPGRVEAPMAALLQKVNDNKVLSGMVASAVGLITLCLLMPEAASAEAAAPFMTPDFFHGLAESTTRTLGDAQLMAEHMKHVPSGTALAAMDALGAVGDQMAKRAQELAVLADADPAKPGLFALLVQFVKGSIVGIKDGLGGIGVPQSAGLAITIFTLFVKGITFPLNYQQMESTTKIQAMQPTIKKLQEQFKDNPQEGNVEIARLYKKYNINPLAALLPVFVQIPIFIALYRALREMAEQNLLDQPFLFLPSLEGPTFDALPGHTTEWLTSGALPPNELAAYLSIPIVLVISQFLTTNLQKAPGQETPAWVNYLPLMTGAFALNVPSGLSLYWIVNNFVTTGSTFAIKDYLKKTDEIKQIEADMAELAKGPMRTFGAADTYAASMSRRDRRAAGVARPAAAVVDTEATVTDAPASAAEPAAMEPGDAAESSRAAKGGKGKGGKKKKR